MSVSARPTLPSPREQIREKSMKEKKTKEALNPQRNAVSRKI